MKILKSPDDLEAGDVRALYSAFDSPITALDCGRKCAPHNPSGKPFCCDICQAVPAAYKSEWAYAQATTDLWHAWREDECGQDTLPEPAQQLREQTPRSMVLLA